MGEPESKRAKVCTGKEQDEEYFKSYADIAIHEDMIADSVRTSAYRLAILRSYESIRGKVVLDVGAGTGILSMFCVQAGAKKVYAVEASTMAEQARLLVKANNMTDKIDVIQAKIEDVELAEKVDVLVSEWMGYFLLYESMLPSVIHARDKWLKKDGLMLPHSATVHLAPINDSDAYEERLRFWENVHHTYKVNMAPLVPFARKCLSDHVHVKTLQVENILAKETQVAHIDINTVTTQDLSHIKSEFKFCCYGCNRLHGFASWFTVQFAHDVEICTSPFRDDTHWQQSVLYIEHPLEVKQDTTISGHLVLAPNKKHNRFLDIDLSYKVGDTDTTSKHYLMNDVIL